MNKGFTPRMVEQMAADVREPDARSLLDGLADRPEFDLVDEFAVRLPLQVIAALLGVPPTDEQWLIDSLVQVFGVSDPANGLPISERVRVMEELGAYAHELGRLRLDQPRDDITTVLVNAEVEDDDGERHRLQPGDYARFFSTLAAAGSETSRNGIAHGVWLLDRHPDQRAVLIADPERVFPTAVEEIVRYSSPVMHMRRNVAHDTELAGQPLVEGDRVVHLVPLGQPRRGVFDEPERFDVTRNPNDHLGYGAGGPHFCLGAHLARMEIHIALEELYRPLPRPRRRRAARARRHASDQRHQAPAGGGRAAVDAGFVGGRASSAPIRCGHGQSEEARRSHSRHAAAKAVPAGKKQRSKARKNNKGKRS